MREHIPPSGGKLLMYEPGESGNPAGKKKVTKNWKTIFNEVLDEELYQKCDPLRGGKPNKRTIREWIVIRLAMDAMQHGDLEKMRELIDRTDGKIPNPAPAKPEGENNESLKDTIININNIVNNNTKKSTVERAEVVE